MLQQMTTGTSVRFVLLDEDVQRFRHAHELCAAADQLDFAMLMFLIGEFEALLEECGLIADDESD